MLYTLYMSSLAEAGGPLIAHLFWGLSGGMVVLYLIIGCLWALMEIL